MHELTDEEFEHIRDFYLAPTSEWSRSRVSRVMDALSVEPGERILDLGCANATFSYHVSQKGARPVGIDRDDAVLVKGREAAIRFAGVTTPRVQGDALRLPFGAGSFDAVINADFIEHTPAEAKPLIFREMFRVLRSGGRGIVYTPNLSRVEWELYGEKIKKKIGQRQEPVPDWRDYVDPDHFGLTRPKLVAEQLRRVGFQTKVHYYEFHLPLLSKLKPLDLLALPFLKDAFSNRFLVEVIKP